MFKRSYTRSISQQTGALASDRIQQSGPDINDNNNKGLSDVTAHQLIIRASKSQKIQFRSSFCEIVIAISTIRGLTTSPTTTATATTAATTTTATYSPLISFLKLFLIGCYYLVAFASLIMLIIYINQSGNQRNNSTQVLKSEPIMISDVLNNIDRNNTSAHLHHTRLTRSIPEDEGLDAASGLAGGTDQPNDESDDDPLARMHSHQGSALAFAGGLPNRSFSMPVMLERRLIEMRTFELASHRVQQQQQQPLAPLAGSNPRAQQQNSSARRKKTPEAAIGGKLLADSHQVARGYSVYNRGSSPISSSAAIKPHSSNDQGQWIPIVSSRAPAESSSTSQPHAAATPPPQDRQLKQSAGIQSRPSQAANKLMIQPPPVHSLASEETGRHSSRLNRPPRNFEMQYQHPNHPDAHPASYNRHWRRPRFNHPDHDSPPPRVNKMYKIVLLCDKTLVSLDYIRRFHFEPGPFVHEPAHHDSDFDENDIDLGFNLDSIFAAAAAASRRHATISNKTAAISPLLSSSTEVNSDTIDSGSDHAKMDLEKRSYLTEEDLLVRCDMWDLEKGLKNRKPPREILQMAVKADFDTVRDAINRCRQLSEKMLPPDDEYRDGIEIMSTEDLISLFSMKRGLIPGTKWCGLGDIASDYNDLGPKHRIDICCRAHDHCPIRLKPFRNDYGVLNIALYTKSHCDCDADFYRCLREVHSRTADMLGNLYFNLMKLQCMREERMKICRETRPIALGFERCVRYEESPMRTVFKFTTPPVAY